MEAEAIIVKETAEFAERQQQEGGVGETNGSADLDEAMDVRASETVGSEANVAELPDAPVDDATDLEPHSISEAPPGPDPVSNVGKDSGDDNGEVVLEAEEDTVIY